MIQGKHITDVKSESKFEYAEFSYESIRYVIDYTAEGWYDFLAMEADEDTFEWYDLANPNWIDTLPTQEDEPELFKQFIGELAENCPELLEVIEMLPRHEYAAA